jgi:uncharacterized protein (TIGR02246 family)
MSDILARVWGWQFGICLAAALAAAVADAQTAPTDDGAAKKFVADYVKAFNAGDMESLGRMWTDDSELIDARGVAVDRKTLMAKRMAKHDGARPILSISLDKVRQLDPDVAMVEGENTLATPQGEVIQQTRFSGVIVKRDDAWRIRLIRQIATQQPRHAPPAEPLRDLSWIVGEWVGVGEHMRVHTSANWDLDRRYIVFRSQYEPENGDSYDAEVRLGWDADANSLKSWYFDSRGVMSTTVWQRSGDHWLGAITGTQSSGAPFTGTIAITRVDSDSYLRRLTNLKAGDQEIPDQELHMFQVPTQPVK